MEEEEEEEEEEEVLHAVQASPRKRHKVDVAETDEERAETRLRLKESEVDEESDEEMRRGEDDDDDVEMEELSGSAVSGTRAAGSSAAAAAAVVRAGPAQFKTPRRLGATSMTPSTRGSGRLRTPGVVARPMFPTPTPPSPMNFGHLPASQAALFQTPHGVPRSRSRRLSPESPVSTPAFTPPSQPSADTPFRTPPAPMFSTAAGTPLSVSSASLAKARTMFDDGGDSGNASGNSAPMFSTAAGTPLSASSASLAKARTMFDDGGDSGNASGNSSSSAASMFSTAAGTPLTASSASLAKARTMFDDGGDSGNASGNSAPMFSTAAGTPLSASSASLAKARTMFDDGGDSGNASGNSSSSAAPMFSTAAGTPLSVSSASLAKARTMFDDGGDSGNAPGNSPSSAASMFSTAAGTPLAASSASLAKARTMFDDGGDSGNPSSNSAPMFSTAAGTPLSASSSSLAKARTMLDDNSNPSPIFSTAAGTPLSVSSSSLAKARTMFDDGGDSGNPSSNSAPMFSTAAGTPLSASSSSLAKARTMLDDNSNPSPIFSTAAGTPLSVSSSSLAKARSMLDPPSNPLSASSSSSLPKAHPIPSPAPSRTPTPQENLPPLNRAPSRRKRRGFQRPRFTSPPAARKARKLTSSAPTTPSVPAPLLFADEARRLGTTSKTPRPSLSSALGPTLSRPLPSPALVRSITSRTAASASVDGLTCSAAHAALLAAGAVPKLCTEKWVRNHFRWIVWKLASMVRTAPNKFPASEWFSARAVLDRLKRRYYREVELAQRSALKRVLEQDEAVGRFMVLCVADIYTGEERASKNCHLELTDGWYSVGAVLDPALEAHIRSGKIFSGLKLRVAGARFQGSAEQCSPLDNHSTKLALRYNSTRRAKWDARLGFQVRQPSFLVDLRSLKHGCGVAPAIHVVVQRLLPVMYVETEEQPSPDGGPPIAKRTVRNQKANDLAERRFRDRLHSRMQLQRQQQQPACVMNSRGVPIDSPATTAAPMDVAQRDVTTFLEVRLRQVRPVPVDCVLTLWHVKADAEVELAEGTELTIFFLEVAPKRGNDDLLHLRTTRSTYWTKGRPRDAITMKRSNRRKKVAMSPESSAVYDPRRSLPTAMLSRTPKHEFFDIVACVLLMTPWRLSGGTHRASLFVGSAFDEILVVDVLRNDEMVHLQGRAEPSFPQIVTFTDIRYLGFDTQARLHRAQTTRNSTLRLQPSRKHPHLVRVRKSIAAFVDLPEGTAHLVALQARAQAVVAPHQTVPASPAAQGKEKTRLEGWLVAARDTDAPSHRLHVSCSSESPVVVEPPLDEAKLWHLVDELRPQLHVRVDDGDVSQQAVLSTNMLAKLFSCLEPATMQRLSSATQDVLSSLNSFQSFSGPPPSRAALKSMRAVSALGTLPTDTAFPGPLLAATLMCAFALEHRTRALGLNVGGDTDWVQLARTVGAALGQSKLLIRVRPAPLPASITDLRLCDAASGMDKLLCIISELVE